MDCQELSPNARKIFERIKEYYPLDPWGKQQWSEEGTVTDNGVFDLKKAEDRSKLISRYESLIGSTIVMFAKSESDTGNKITRKVFHFKMSKKWIELAVLLHELDFQIETMDLVDYFVDH